MKRFVAVVAVALVSVFAPPVGATSWSTDQSDLYYNPDESGWGAELVQRGSTVVATIYVYDPAGNPIWYNAALAPTATPFVWSGDLYTYRGPWFGTAPFNPAAVQSRKVGTMTWYGQYVDAGVLTYTVDGVPVTKNIQRISLAIDDFSGTYVAAAHISSTGCASPADNGTTEAAAALSIAQSSSTISLGLAGPGGTCTFTGPLSQAGQFGEASGTYSCTTGEFGTFQIFEMIVGVNHLAGRIRTSGTRDRCQSDGYFVGMRHRP